MAGPVFAAGLHHGRVTAFDARRGLGTVAGDDGTPFGFHATAIADGSRMIDEGTAVTFTVAPGARGCYEARSLLPDAAAGRAAASHHGLE